MQRSAGILLPISSLPSPYGIGCFSQEAYDFVDWLKEAGQTYWQILPLGVTSYGDSPYQSFSAFAGNPYFISLDALVEEGVLTADECKKANFGRKADDINYSRLYTERGRLLRLAYSRSDIGHNEALTAFCEKNKWWLDDFALFMAVKDRFEGKPWIEWAEDIRLRWQPAMDYYRRELYFEVEYHKYLQFKFDEQWRRLKAYANSKGIRIIGDIPIYVALDSADAWANPGLFQLDQKNLPTAVAGVPPDGFSPTGQLWGNPLYRWEAHRETGYQWWITRLWYCFELYDVVRILLFVFRLRRGVFLCSLLVSLILQDFFEGLLLGRLFAFLCAGCGFPYPVADVPQLLQILLYLGQWCFQVCDFVHKFRLFLQKLFFRAVLILRVLGKVGTGFLKPGNLRVFQLEFFLSFLEKYLLVFLINGLTFLTVRPGGKDSVNHVAAGFLWLHLLSVVGGRFPGRFYKVFQILHGGKSLSLEIGQGFADCL